MDDKRVYSLNLCAYLISLGFNFEYYEIDPENGYLFYVFPDAPGIKKAIWKYKNDEWLQNFLGIYKDLKKRNWEIKHEEGSM